MKFLRSLGLAILAGILIAGSAEAAGDFHLGTDVLAHKSPDGVVAFVTGPDVPLLKVYATDDNTPAYYFEFHQKSRKIAREQGPIHARLLADEQEIPLMPVGSEADMHGGNTFSGQYRVSEADLQTAVGAKVYLFQLVNSEGKILWKQKGKHKTTEALGKILAVAPQSYLREGVIRDEKSVDSVRRDSRPRVFLPQVSPNEVQAWLFLHQQSLLKDDYSKFLYEDFDFYYNEDDPNLVEFIGGRIGSSVPLITFETRPYDGGTMLAMMKDQADYGSWRGLAYTKGMMTADDGDIISMTSVWRMIDDQWDGFLNDAYKAFNDYADFGFTLTMEHKKGQGNRFFLGSVREDLPSLVKGDELLSLNGEEVAWYKPNELELKLLQLKEPALLHIRTASGEERDVSVTPILKSKENASVLPTDLNAFFKEHKIEGQVSPVFNSGNYPELFMFSDPTYHQPSVRELWQKSQEEKEAAKSKK